MSFHSWLQRLRSLTLRRSELKRGAHRTSKLRPSIELLEDRLTPSFSWIGSFPAGPTPPYAVVTGDFNSDGNLDVTTAADTANLLAGNGDGTLQPPLQLADLPSTPSQPTDFTGDDIGDGFYIDVSGREIVQPGRGDGTFGDPIYSQWGVPYTVMAWATGDLNSDGRLDIVLASSTDDMGGVGSLLLGRGDGTFYELETFELGVDPAAARSANATALAIGDFDADGRPDVAAGGDSNGEGAVAVLLNDGNWPAVPPPPTPSIAIHDSTVAEGNTGTVAARFSVTLSAAYDVPVTVAYASGNGTATAGSDYVASSGTLTFAPGETSKTVHVLINGDRIAEANETFSVNLSSPTNAIIADGHGVGTILDDEPRISISDVSKSEGRKNQTTLFTFTVTLSAAYDQPVTMSFQTVNGTATTGNSDYVAKSGTLTFAPGETTKTITITVKGDSKREGNELFYLDLFGNSSHSQVTKNRGLGTILNDD